MEPGPSFHLHPSPPRVAPTARTTPSTATPPGGAGGNGREGVTTTRKSPGRSFSLSLKSKGKLPLRNGLHDRRWEELIIPNRKPKSPTTTTTTSTSTSTSTGDSLRRTMSSEDTQSITSSSTPPLPPPKDPIPQRPPDSDPAGLQLRDVRMKMSSQDQEAMRKLRLTMDMSLSDSGGESPIRVGSYSSLGQGQGQRPPLGSSRSTLSRQITSEDLDDPMPTNVSEVASEPEPEPDLIIAVIGHRNVGKSTVIKRATKAWGITDPVHTSTNEGHTITSSFSQVQPGGKIKNTWRVEFLEIDLDMLQPKKEGVSIWPALVPEIHGTILCYDAQRKDTLEGLDIATRSMIDDGRPAVIFACKSDPGASLEVEPSMADVIGQPINVGLIEVTENTSDGKSKMRNGLRWLLYKLEQRHRRQQRRLLALDLQAEQSRVAEEVISPDSDASSGGHRFMYGRQSLNMTHGEDGSDKRSSTSSTGWMMKNPMRPTPGALDGAGPKPVKLRIDTQNELETVLYLPLQEILNRLIGAIVSLEDERFIKAFFMTYRRFCTPADVLAEFLARVEQAIEKGIAQDVRMWSLQKLTGALIDWLKEYPGDLCDPEATRLFKAILARVVDYFFMAHLTIELIMIEDGIPIYTDLDKSWSLQFTNPPSSNVEANASAPQELVVDSLYELDIMSPTDLDENDNSSDTPLKRLPPSTGSLLVDEEASVIMERRLSGSDSRVALSYHSDKRSFGPDNPSEWQSAVAWVIDHDPLEFAAELTRMQWDLFVTIRGRDVLRHDFGKEKDTPVGQAIAFFDRISRWVSTMILASPKPKHRARVYERFTLIAHQLRRLKNYDSLYAVISGMQETSIHRLSQTHSHVQLGPGILKDWQSHLKLMDPRGGYVHYRRALQADLSHGRAAIPLVNNLLGLVSRLQGARKEDVRPDGEVQWDKFTLFYDILSIVKECQGKDPMVSGAVSEPFRRLIEDTPIIHDEDALYARSRMLEPLPGQRGIGTGRVMRKLANMGL